MRRPAPIVLSFLVVLVALALGLGGCQDLLGEQTTSMASTSVTTAESSSVTSLADGSTVVSGASAADHLDSGQPAVPSGVPTIVGLDPQQGPESGGNYVNIFGTGFTPDSEVTFGGAPVFQMNYLSSAHLQAKPGGHSPGLVEVVVRSPHGSSSTDGSVNDYTYVRAPVIYAVTPDGCLLGNPVWVVITGSGFEGVQEVRFAPYSGDVSWPCDQWKQVSSTEVRALAPNVDASGVYKVQIFTIPGGTTHVSSASAADFRFMEPIPLQTFP